jgi:hypothetical protein
MNKGVLLRILNSVVKALIKEIELTRITLELIP